MNPALIALIEQFIQLAISVAPQLIQEGETVVSLVRSGQDPTAEEQAVIDGGLDKANAAVVALVIPSAPDVA